MPRYSYECLACGYEGDLTRAVNARDEHAGCPSCGAQMKRTLGSFAVRQGASPFRPKNLAQQLAGPGVVAPQYATQTSVLRR